ncbi:MAG: FAD-dependent monooxygenase [Acidimicrobiales bacterium]
MVIGAGPVGLCLALELGAAGSTVWSWNSDRGGPRRSRPPTTSACGRWSTCADSAAGAVKQAFPADRGGAWIALTHLGGFEVSRIDEALAARGPGPFSPEWEVWAPKPLFDPILLEAAESFRSVRIRHGVRADAVTDTANGVRVLGTAAGDDAAGPEVAVEARFAVSCEGAGSAAAAGPGIPMTGPPPLPVVIHSAYFRSRRVAGLLPPGGVQYTLLGDPGGPGPAPFGAGVMVAVDGFERWRLHGIGLDLATRP